MSKNNIFFSFLESLDEKLNNYYKNNVNDQAINDCLIKLYFFLMSSEEEKCDKYYNDFRETYTQLNNEQKEFIQNEVAKIININDEQILKKKER